MPVSSITGSCPPEDCGGVWGYAELLENSTGRLAQYHAFEPTGIFNLEDANFFVQKYLEEVEDRGGKVKKRSIY